LAPPFDANKLAKAVMWPAIVWIVTEILFRIATLVNQAAGAQFQANIYSVSSTIGLALGIWAGASVKEAKGTYQEAIAGGVIVGLACGIPASDSVCHQHHNPLLSNRLGWLGTQVERHSTPNEKTSIFFYIDTFVLTALSLVSPN